MITDTVLNVCMNTLNELDIYPVKEQLENILSTDKDFVEYINEYYASTSNKLLDYDRACLLDVLSQYFTHENYPLGLHTPGFGLDKNDKLRNVLEKEGWNHG